MPLLGLHLGHDGIQPANEIDRALSHEGSTPHTRDRPHAGSWMPEESRRRNGPRYAGFVIWPTIDTRRASAVKNR